MKRTKREEKLLCKCSLGNIVAFNIHLLKQKKYGQRFYAARISLFMAVLAYTC